MAYRNNTNKVWTAVLAVLLALVLAGTAALVGFLSDGFKDWSKFKAEEQTEEQEEGETADEGGAIISEGESNGISLMSARIAPEAYAENGISPMAESAQQLTAIVTPATATNQAVDWTFYWANSSSSWASGKSVTDYLTVTPTSDGSLTANVSCLEDFGEQIIVKVTSRQNPDAWSTCTVDYAPRVVDIKFTADDLTFYAEEDSVTLSYTDSRSLGWSAVWSDGTLTPSTTAVSFSYQLNDTLLSRLNSSGISFSNDKLDTSSAFPSGTGMYLWGGSALFSDYVGGRVEKDYSLLQVPLNQANQAIELARSLITEVMYTINYSITSETATYAGSIAVYFTSASLTVSVDGISMSTSNLIF